MIDTRAELTRRVMVSVFIAGIFVALAITACKRQQAAPASSPPAKVANPTTEAALATVTLTPQSEKRLAIAIAPVEQRAVPHGRLVAGEVVVPPGGSIEVNAPVAGTLAASRSPLVAGRAVRQGEPLFRLVPLQAGTADVRINAERDVAAARAGQEAAQRRADRAEQLLKDGSGSRRAAEEARADLLTAQATLQAAMERLDLAKRSRVTEGNELIVEAPISGVVELVSAQPGQTVAASAPLARISRTDRLWIRVPVYAGDLRNIDQEQGASVLRLGEPNDAAGVVARRVAAPPAATPSASAIDLMFEMPGSQMLSPGERVNVRLAGKSSETAIVVPHSALLHDIHGGTWVYVRTAPHVYARRRVEVKDVVNNLALLSRGPDVNEPVVISGAAELYGVEFGVGK
jgi:RND family efflux transporter MFP subunit